MAQNENIILEARSVSCRKAPATEQTSCVHAVNVAIQKNSVNLISGEEQSGKGLLLCLLGLLEMPDKGEILFRGEGTSALSEDGRAALRNQHFGYLFAQPYLLPSFSVIENVAMPLFKVSGVDAEEAQRRTEEMLTFAGMLDYAQASIDRLALVQQHRVSLARALVNHPEVLIIENIDAGMSGAELAQFIELIHRACSELGATAIMTGRDQGLQNAMDRVIELRDGKVLRDSFSEVKQGGATV